MTITDHDLIVVAYVLAMLWLTCYAARAIRRWSDTHDKRSVYLRLTLYVGRVQTRVTGSLLRLHAWLQREAYRT